MEKTVCSPYWTGLTVFTIGKLGGKRKSRQRHLRNDALYDHQVRVATKRSSSIPQASLTFQSINLTSNLVKSTKKSSGTATNILRGFTLFFNDSVSYVIWASCLSGVQAVTDRVTMLSLISAIQSAMFLK